MGRIREQHTKLKDQTKVTNNNNNNNNNNNSKMKMYGGVEVQIHVFSSSALVAGEWSASRPANLPPWKTE
jgi:hypothetical protein